MDVCYCRVCLFFFFKQKTAYEIVDCDWSSDVCSSDLEMGAMEQLELWEIYQDFWCEHKPSMTCYYRDDE